MSKKLLLADDSITIQKVIQITFAHEDYELTITDNGDAALAKAQEIKPDLIMADVYMPGKNGYELTTAIRQDAELQNVPVLLLAGSFEPFDEDKAKSCQANAWIEKPFESQSLIDKIAELLSAAPAATDTSAVATEPEPVIASAEVPVEEAPETSFAEPETAEPQAAAASEDPFGDISFEDEVPVAAAEPEPFVVTEPEPAAVADDWSDVAAAPETEAEQAFVEETSDDFSFAEEAPVVEDVAIAEETPVAAVEPDSFEMGDDEIMPLDDDDILGAEDLEPVPPEQTLASWSRDDVAGDDVFVEEVAESVAVEEDVFATSEEPAFVEEASEVAVAPDVMDAPSLEVSEPPVEESVTFDEPVLEEPVTEEPVTFEESTQDVVVAETEPASVAAAMVDVEDKAAALSEEDVEKIIEKVVTQVVEKLAGTILERVAWEVVPDMAENLIKEEIRKIKDAAA